MAVAVVVAAAVVVVVVGGGGVGVRNSNSSSSSRRPDLLCGPKQSYQLSHWWMLTTFLTPLREQDLTHIASAVHHSLISLIHTKLTTVDSPTPQGLFRSPIKNLTRHGRRSPIIQKIASCTRILSVLMFARSEVALASPFNTMNPQSTTTVNNGSASGSSSSGSSSGGSGSSGGSMNPSQQEVLKRLVVVKGAGSCHVVFMNNHNLTLSYPGINTNLLY